MLSLNAITPPSKWTIAGWFKSGPGGGVIFSQGSTQFTGGSWAGILIWVSSSGVGVSYTENSSKSAAVGAFGGPYNDGNWHFVTVTYTPNGHGTLSLYMDGALAGSTKDDGAPTASGGVTLGYSNSSITFDTPTSNYLSGALAGIAWIPSVLSASQVTSLYNSASFSAYTSAVQGYSPREYWALQDTGMVPYTGALPGVSGSIGNYLDVTVGLTNGGASSCWYPVSSSTCPAPSSSDTLSGLASGPVGTADLASGSSATVTVAVSQDSATPSTVYLVDVLAGVRETGANGPWSVSLRYESKTQL
ncbi:MAG: LamG-like jellyroll fold domain-containing protein [Leptospirillum sp.]